MNKIQYRYYTILSTWTFIITIPLLFINYEKHSFSMCMSIWWLMLVVGVFIKGYIYRKIWKNN